MDGELVTEAFDYDGGRRVTVYVPPEPATAVVWCGDGQVITPWAIDLEQADVPPTLLVGVHRTDSADEMVRLNEYSPQFDLDVFAAHETFVVDEVRAWVRDRFGVDLPPERNATFGVSASTELALTLALRHPDVYGVALGCSPGGLHPPAELPDQLPRTYLCAGTLEPWFAENAQRWVDAFRAAGADVTYTEREGDHGDPFWRAELPRMISWAFA